MQIIPFRIKALVLVALLLACACNRIEAATIFVCPDRGNDSATGQDRGSALRSLAVAVAQARGGDMILMLPGTHYLHSLTVRDIPGASREQRLTIRAEIPGQTTLSQAWPEAARGELAWRHENDGIYSAPQRTVEGELVGSIIGGFQDRLLTGWRTLAELRDATCGYNPTHSGNLRGTTFRTPGYGFAHEAGRTYLRLPDRSDPNGQRVVLGLGSWSKDKDLAMLRIEGVNGLVIDGLRFEGAGLGLWLESHGSAEDSGNNVVRNCRFEWTLRGINARSSSSTYEWNEYSYTGLRRLIDEMRDLNGRFATAEIFSLGYAPVRMFGMFIYGDRGQGDIRFNYVHQAWDGMHFGNMPDTQVHRNVLEDCIDNAIEIEAGYAERPTGHNIHFHRNLVLGLANGAVSQTKKGPVVGPHYVYRNVFVGHADPGWSSWVFAKSRSEGASEGLIYHHNLIWMRRSSSLYWAPDSRAHRAFIETMDWRNNVLIFDQLSQSEAIFPVAHNVLAGSTGPKPGLQGPGGFHVSNLAGLGFRDPARYDFTLRAGSPLIDAGQPLPEDFLARLERTQSIAGREQYRADVQAHTGGAAPDIGPFEFGQEMGPDWPRPRRSVINVAPFDAEPRLQALGRTDGQGGSQANDLARQQQEARSQRNEQRQAREEERVLNRQRRAPTREPDTQTLTTFDARLRARLEEANKERRDLRFTAEGGMTMRLEAFAGEQVVVRHLQGRGEMRQPWALLTAGHRYQLAVSALRSLERADQALCAFYGFLDGRPSDAWRHLAEAGDHAAAVIDAFGLARDEQ